MKPIQKVNYFQKREEWKISDVLMNPMIMMMVLPLLLMTVLPKMLNDPETQKEMQEMQKNMASSRNQVNISNISILEDSMSIFVLGDKIKKLFALCFQGL